MQEMQVFLHGFDAWGGKNPWRKAWQPTLIFLPGESHGWRSMAGYTPSVQFSSVAQSCPTLCDPMNHSTPGLPVHHQLPEFTQTHIHRVGDAIQPSHPLSFHSPPAFSLSSHQGLFQWVSSSHHMAKVLEFQLLASVLPMNIQDWFPLGLTGWISLLSKGLLRVFSSTTIWEHQFFGLIRWQEPL